MHVGEGSRDDRQEAGRAGALVRGGATVMSGEWAGWDRRESGPGDAEPISSSRRSVESGVTRRNSAVSTVMAHEMTRVLIRLPCCPEGRPRKDQSPCPDPASLAVCLGWRWEL